jgi:type IV pilus assembly protein PilO
MGNNFSDKISELRMMHKVLIFAGTVVLIVGLFAWFVYIPKSDEIKTITVKLDTLEKEITLAKVRAKNLRKLEAEFAKAQGDLKVAMKLLPTTSEIPSLLKNITKLGNDSNLEFLLFQPENQISKEFYVEIPVSIEVLGSYHDVAIFFDKVGKLDRIVNVINVNMIPTSQLSTTLKTSCKATTYMFKEHKTEKENQTENVRKKKK